MGRNSRLQLNPTTGLPSINSFGELGIFLRRSIADEDSRQLSESMSQLAANVETIIDNLRLNRVRSVVAPMLVDLLTVLRSHRHLVVGLGPSWRSLYEYPAYLQALNNFRVLIGQWLLDGGAGSPDLLLTCEDFELVAWRTLSDGLLLIDMYEQWIALEQQAPVSVLSALDEPQVERARQWWRRLRR
jgi:hypothetical protein